MLSGQVLLDRAGDTMHTAAGAVALQAFRTVNPPAAFRRFLGANGRVGVFLGRSAKEFLRGLPGAYDEVKRMRSGLIYNIGHLPAGVMPGVDRLPVPAGLKVLRATVQTAFQGRELPAKPHVLLLGPGRSWTDPLYALWLAEILPASTLTVLDRDSHPAVRDFYGRLSMAHPHLRTHFGSEGSFIRDEIPQADLILSLHPAGNQGSLTEMAAILSSRLAPGGIGILQKDFAAEPPDTWEALYQDAESLYRTHFEILHGPVRQPLFTTPFSVLYGDSTHVVVLQQKAD